MWAITSSSIRSGLGPRSFRLLFRRNFLRREIEVIMMAAARIEPCLACGTLIRAIQILPDTYLPPAISAHHCQLIPFAARPDFDRVVGQGIVAILARVIEAAALHLDSHDVQYLVVMNAASLRIQINSVHGGMEFGHAYKVDEESGKRRVDDWQSQFRRIE